METIRELTALEIALTTIADQQGQIARLQQDAVELRADNARLRDKVYDLLPLRHGSIDARRVKVNEAIGQDGE